MGPITINGFLGANLAFDELLLPAGVGVESTNQRPGFGDLRPWNGLGSTINTVPTSPQRNTIWRMGQDLSDVTDYWLGWSAVVDAITGYENYDPTERTYFTGSGTPKWTDNSIGLTGGPPYPQATRELGVPAPTTALTAAQNAAGTGDDQVFRWAYTFVNDLGWESAPSAPSNELIAKPGATFDLSGFDTAPAGNYGITTIRLYRYQPGANGDGDYFLLREWLIGSTPSNPIDDARSLSADPIATTGWRPCPGIPNGGSLGLTEQNARGLKKLWNGMAGVGVGKSFRLCVPNTFYAWPIAYEIQLAAEFVAAGVFGQRVLLLTQGDATVAVGTEPDAMDSELTKTNRPCSSARSVVEFNEAGDASRGVAWASEECLCWYGDGGFRNLTDGILTAEQWKALEPSTMVATRYQGLYICFYNDGSSKGFVIDPRNPTGVYFLSDGYDATFRDPLTDRLFVLDGGNVREWNAGSAMTATFKSKLIQMREPMSIGAVEVIAKDFPVTVKMWADGTLRLDRTFDSNVIARPAQGWSAKDNLQFEVSSAERVIAVNAAQTIDDL